MQTHATRLHDFTGGYCPQPALNFFYLGSKEVALWLVGISHAQYIDHEHYVRDLTGAKCKLLAWISVSATANQVLAAQESCSQLTKW